MFAFKEEILNYNHQKFSDEEFVIFSQGQKFVTHENSSTLRFVEYLINNGENFKTETSQYTIKITRMKISYVVKNESLLFTGKLAVQNKGTKLWINFG